MRRFSVLLTLCFALWCVPAHAQAVAPNFTVSPASVAPGKPVTFAFRANGSGKVRARVDLLAPGKAPVRAKLGVIRAGRSLKIGWTAPATTGSYTARLVITAHRSTEYERAPLAIVTPPTSGVFPVQGPYDFGGADARFGAQRDGHIHQGQDVVAAEGTPIVSPVAGTVSVVDFQAGGAGNYVVIHGADTRDYVFMHLEDGSTLVKQGDGVTAGERIGSVGATGDADGPHLHFEIWPDGWYAKGSQPIDPLPQLQAWAG
jgi:murein DD-endopeptidase MepM/ murein hydrolase activator NlpD